MCIRSASSPSTVLSAFHTMQPSSWNFNGRNAQDGRTVLLCQIWSKSVKRRPRYGDFSIFQDGGRRHLGFLKFETFNGRTAQEGRNASPCQIWSKSVEMRPRYGDYSIFQDGGRPSSCICCVCSDHTRRAFEVFIAVENLVGIDAVVLMICMFFDFTSLAWKRLFKPKIVFWGFYRLNGQQCQRN